MPFRMKIKERKGDEGPQRTLDQLLAFRHRPTWLTIGAGTPVINLKAELEHADAEQREVSWAVIDVVLNEGGPSSAIADVNSALDIVFDDVDDDMVLLREYAKAIRVWFTVHANEGLFYEALNAIMATAPIYAPDHVLEDLVPRSHTAVGPRATRTIADGTPRGLTFEVYSDYELRVAIARWSASSNTPGTAPSLTVQERQAKAAELEAAMLAFPFGNGPDGTYGKLYVDQEDSVAVATIKAMVAEGKTDKIKMLSFVFLDRLIKIRAGQLDIPGWQTHMKEVESYDDFDAHFTNCKRLFSRSKASVINLMKADYYFAIFAAAPAQALKSKGMNRNSNEKKQEYLDLAKAQQTVQDNAAQGSNATSGTGTASVTRGAARSNVASAVNTSPAAKTTSKGKQKRKRSEVSDSEDAQEGSSVDNGRLESSRAPAAPRMSLQGAPVRNWNPLHSANPLQQTGDTPQHIMGTSVGFMPSPSYVGNLPFRGGSYPPAHGQWYPGVSMHQPQQPFSLPRQPYSPSPAPGSMGQSQWNCDGYGNTVSRPADARSNQPMQFPGNVSTSYQLPDASGSSFSQYGGNTSHHGSYGYEDYTAGHQSNHRGSIQATDEFRYDQLHEESPNARALGGADESRFDLTDVYPELRGEGSFEEPNTQ